MKRVGFIYCLLGAAMAGLLASGCAGGINFTSQRNREGEYALSGDQPTMSLAAGEKLTYYICAGARTMP